MSEAQSSSQGRRRRDFSLTASVQNWSHNLPADHGMSSSLICLVQLVPQWLKLVPQQIILGPDG